MSQSGTVRQQVEASWKLRRERGINPYLDPIQMYQMLLVLADQIDALTDEVAIVNSPGWKPKKRKEAA